jgi:hypothetical protein
MRAQDKYSPTLATALAAVTIVVPSLDKYSHGNLTRDYETQRLRLAETTMTMTTMASSIVRIHAAYRIHFPTCLSYSCRRRAMMSAWSPRSPPQPQTAANPQPPLHDSPPIVIPNSKAPLNPDAGSPQIAARPPPAPKLTRPKPTIRAQKVALTIVSNRRSDLPHPLLFHSPTISAHFFFLSPA